MAKSRGLLPKNYVPTILTCVAGSVEVSYNSESEEITKRNIKTGDIVLFGTEKYLDAQIEFGLIEMSEMTISNDGLIVFAIGLKTVWYPNGSIVCVHLVSFDLITGKELSSKTLEYRVIASGVSAYGAKSFKLNKSLNGTDFYPVLYDGMTGKMYKILPAKSS